MWSLPLVVGHGVPSGEGIPGSCRLLPDLLALEAASAQRADGGKGERSEPKVALAAGKRGASIASMAGRRSSRKALWVGVFALLTLSTVACKRVTPEGHAGEEALEEVGPPAGYSVSSKVWDGNGYLTPQWIYRGPVGAVDPEAWHLPNGYERDDREPKKNWVWSWSLITSWTGPSPTEPGECSLLLEIRQMDWDSQQADVYQVTAICTLDRYD